MVTKDCHCWSVDGIEIRMAIASGRSDDPICSTSAHSNCNIVMFSQEQVSHQIPNALSKICVAIGNRARLFMFEANTDKWDKAPLLGLRNVPGSVVFREALSPYCEGLVTLAAHIFAHDQERSITHVMYPEEWISPLWKTQSPIERRLFLHTMFHLQQQFFGGWDTQIECDRFKIDIGYIDEDSGIKLAIEADGHDYHDRTKQQAQHDKARDRVLIANGWRVVRFTGSEIWNNPSSCALEIKSLLNNLSEECA